MPNCRAVAGARFSSRVVFGHYPVPLGGTGKVFTIKTNQKGLPGSYSGAPSESGPRHRRRIFGIALVRAQATTCRVSITTSPAARKTLPFFVSRSAPATTFAWARILICPPLERKAKRSSDPPAGNANQDRDQRSVHEARPVTHLRHAQREQALVNKVRRCQ